MPCGAAVGPRPFLVATRLTIKLCTWRANRWRTVRSSPSNSSMQRTALHTAADAQRQTVTTGILPDRDSLVAIPRILPYAQRRISGALLESQAVQPQQQALLFGIARSPSGRSSLRLGGQDRGPTLPLAAFHFGAEGLVGDHVLASRSIEAKARTSPSSAAVRDRR